MKTCENCGTTRRTRLTRGHCQKCYKLVLLREKITAWRFEDIESLPKPYPQGSHFKTLQYFEIIKNGCIEQLTSRLIGLKCKEHQYQNGADGITIEHMLRRIGKKFSGRRYNNLHYGDANRIDWTFPAEQKRELYRLLMEIEETMPQKPCSWSKAIDDARLDE